MQNLLRLHGIQAKLTVSQPDDVSEQEADRVADQVMRMEAQQVQREPIEDENITQIKPLGITICPLMSRQVPIEESLQTKVDSEESTEVGDDMEARIVALQGNGAPLSDSVRSHMEPRFGVNFNNVRVHTNEEASETAKAVNAQAYTIGRDIVFSAGLYAPESESGKRLLAHELTHVVQQREVSDNLCILRQCSDPTFCKPYASAVEIAQAKNTALSIFVPLLSAMFGSDVGGLWKSFLNRKPGDSLTPVVFDKPGNSIYDAFANSWAIANEQDTILDLIAARIGRISLQDYTETMMSIDNFVTPAEKELSTEFENPFSIPGNIAGGISWSDAGWDYRRILRGNVSFLKTPIIGGITMVKIETTLLFEVGDAIDFCPGACGAPAEQIMTVPLSRLEASREAYDMPYVVRFFAPNRTKTILV
jgi:hypothetical protein